MNKCGCKSCELVQHDSDCAVHNEPASPNGVCNCKDATLSGVSAYLSEQGLVAVPKEPTGAMTDAGIRVNQESCGYDMVGSTLAKIYKAMISAAT